MEHINGYSNLIIAVATVVLVIITGIYVYLTGRMLKTADNPQIVVSLCSNENNLGLVMLCIENIGTGIARNISFETNWSLKYDGKKSLGEFGFLKNGISHLRPGQKFECFFVSTWVGLDNLNLMPFKIDVSYNDSANKNYKDGFNLDFSQFEGLSWVGELPLVEIASTLKGIKADLQGLITGMKKPIVRIESSPLRGQHTDLTKEYWELQEKYKELQVNTSGNLA